MNTAILAIITEKLRVMRPACAELENPDAARSVTFETLALDSLDALQLAMELETALGIDIEITEFQKRMTLGGLSEKLAAVSA